MRPSFLALKEKAASKTASETNASNGSFLFGFGAGATTIAAAWAIYELNRAKQTKMLIHEPLL